MHGAVLCRVVESFCSPTHNIVPRISWNPPSMSWDHEEIRKFSEHDYFSVAPAEILDSNMVLLLSTISLLVSHCLSVHTRYT